MTDIGELRKRLDAVDVIESALDRRMMALAVITEACADIGIRPILVGGAAVELYTLGGYATADIDVVMPSVPKVDDLMSRLGFQKEGRFWVRKDLQLFIEAPSDTLAGDYDRVIEVDINGKPVYVIGVEDLIIDRLNAYVHWRSEEDGRWARRLLSTQTQSLDLEYLKARASQEGTTEALSAMLSEESDAQNNP